MTVAKVILSDEALADLEAGRDFYEGQQSGLGLNFVTSLLSDIASLQLNSGIHPVRFGYHRMLSKRFPFAIYYSVSRETTRIVAALDMRRDPRGIRSALRHRHG